MRIVSNEMDQKQTLIPRLKLLLANSTSYVPKHLLKVQRLEIWILLGLHQDQVFGRNKVIGEWI